MVRIGILRDIAAREKLKAAVDFVSGFIDNNQKVVIFCNLHDIVDRLLRAFPKTVCITGRQTMQEKQQSIDKFVNDKNTMIVIASIKAASAGVDGLQKSCSNVLFIEEPWTAADRDQAESRVHRNGLKDGATMYHMHGKNTIDEKMWMIIEENRALNLLKQTAEIVHEIKRLKDIENEYNKQVESLFESLEIEKWDNQFFTITRKKGYERKTFDNRTFSADYPELAGKYTKTTNVKPTIITKLKAV